MTKGSWGGSSGRTTWRRIIQISSLVRLVRWQLLKSRFWPLMFMSLSFPGLIGSLRSLRIVQVSCGEAHSLALAATGHLHAWGSNSHGQLGLAPLVPTGSFTAYPMYDGMLVCSASRKNERLFCRALFRRKTRKDYGFSPFWGLSPLWSFFNPSPRTDHRVLPFFSGRTGK